MPRIISLLPSATELVAAVGAADMLVGRSHECDEPASIAHLPILTAARTHGEDWAAIDAQVRAALADNRSLYTLDQAALAALKPDLIITQDLCEVCSIDLAAVQAAALQLDPRPAILSLNPGTIEDVFDDLLRVGEALGRTQAAAARVVELRSRMDAAQAYVNPYTQAPVIGFLEWTDPLFCAGHWTVQLIERAGGLHPLNPTEPRKNTGTASGLQQGERIAGKSVRIPPEVFAALGPEYLIIAPCGLSLAQTRAAARQLAQEPWFTTLPAVRNGRVALVDGNQMFNRPGPRLVDAFEFLVGFIQERPDLIPTGFPWERLSP